MGVKGLRPYQLEVKGQIKKNKCYYTLVKSDSKGVRLNSSAEKWNVE